MTAGNVVFVLNRDGRIEIITDDACRWSRAGRRGCARDEVGQFVDMNAARIIIVVVVLIRLTDLVVDIDNHADIVVATRDGGRNGHRLRRSTSTASSNA